MGDGFDELLNLAKIDRQLVGLKKILDAFPADAARQQLRCDAAGAALAEVENSAKALNGEIAKEQLEIKTCQQEIAALNQKINIVKNTKEYAIITERIKDMNDNIARHEERQLAAMGELEALQDVIREKRGDAEDEDRAREKLQREAAAKSGEIRERQKQLAAERQAQIAKVEACGTGFMPVYNAALRRGKGLAMSLLKDGVCSECQRRATPNLIAQAGRRNHPEKCLCDGCGRLLYLDPAAGGE